MTGRVDSLSAPRVAASLTGAAEAGSVAQGGPKKADAGVLRAAREFEAVFVRQLLASARVGGQKSDSGYGAMVVDALATGIAQSGGLGLARSIDEALARMAIGRAPPALPLAPAAPPVGLVGESDPTGPKGKAAAAVNPK